MDDRVIPSRHERRVLGHAPTRADCLAILPVAPSAAVTAINTWIRHPPTVSS